MTKYLKISTLILFMVKISAGKIDRPPIMIKDLRRWEIQKT